MAASDSRSIIQAFYTSQATEGPGCVEVSAKGDGFLLPSPSPLRIDCNTPTLPSSLNLSWDQKSRSVLENFWQLHIVELNPQHNGAVNTDFFFGGALLQCVSSMVQAGCIPCGSLKAVVPMGPVCMEHRILCHGFCLNSSHSVVRTQCGSCSRTTNVAAVSALSNVPDRQVHLLG